MTCYRRVLSWRCRAARANLAVMSHSSKIHCNGLRVRERRTQLSMTQEKLGHMSKVDARTVQRAEASEYLQLETIAAMAEALKVTVGDITMPGTAIVPVTTTADEPAHEAAESNAVVLRRMRSGKMLLDLICDSFSGHLYCAAEPTVENIDMLSAVVEKLEALIPNPWSTPMETETLSLAARLRAAVGLSEQLSQLEKVGIAVFAGTYTARAQVPHYDMDEGQMFTRMNQKFEPVTVCRISVNAIGVERVTVKVTDEWREPSPALTKLSNKSEVDDDIPF